MLGHRVLRGCAKLWFSVLRWFTYARTRWSTYRTVRRARRELRTGCENREQRLEDADAPAWLLDDLHSLVHTTFGQEPTLQGLRDVERHLELYTRVAIARQRYRIELRRATPSAVAARLEAASREGRSRATSVIERRRLLCRRWAEAMKDLDRQLLEIEGLIRLGCERALYRAG
jgi:hypothetical protein